MPYKDDYVIIKKDRKSKWVFWVFFGILGFLLIYFPFFAPNLRFQASNFFSRIFYIFGTIFISLGVLMIVFGLILVLCKRAGFGISLMLIGVLLVFLGSYFAFPETIGASYSGKEVPKGYH